MAKLSSLIGKPAVRALGIAESFVLSYPRSIFCGVVYRSDGLVDGVIVDYATVGGDDATDTVIRMVKKCGRQDIHVILLDGCIVSWYNIIDLERIYQEVKIPVLALTFEPIEGDVERAIRKIFSPEVAERKIEQFRKLPEPIRVQLPEGEIYVRCVGIQQSPKLVKIVISRFIREGKRPEPIRVAKLVANAILRSLVQEKSKSSPEKTGT